MTLGAMPIAREGKLVNPIQNQKFGYTRKHNSDRHSDNGCCGKAPGFEIGAQGNDDSHQNNAKRRERPAAEGQEGCGHQRRQKRAQSVSYRHTARAVDGRIKLI